MKAEDILIAYSGKGYYSRELLIEAMKAYAKDQITKDRERVKKLNIIMIEPPIILD